MQTEPPVNARVTHRFDASSAHLFDAFLDPEKVGLWMLASGGEMEGIKVDARVGGAFTFVVRRNGQVIDHIGEYLEIDRPRRLVFTWGVAQDPAEPSRVIIDIVPLERGCELTLTHELHPDWADFASRAEASWSKMLGVIETALS